MTSSWVTFATLVIFFGETTLCFDSVKYEEKECANAVPAADLKEDFISKTALWYVPMASSYFYHSWVEKFTNQSATEDKLLNLCLKFAFLGSKSEKSTASYMVLAGGVNKVTTYQCAASSLQTQSCEGVMYTPGYVPGIESEETIVKTDNQNYMLMVQCIKKTLKAWYVMTPTDTPPSTAVKKEALITAIGLGFDKRFAGMLSYDNCKKPQKALPAN